MNDALAQMNQFNQLMDQQRYGAALQLAVQSMQHAPKNSRWALGAGRAALALGRLRDAAEHLARAERLAPDDCDCQLQSAIVDHRLGRSASAEARLRTLLAHNTANRVDVNLVLAEVLHRSNQSAALEKHFASGGSWRNDARATLFAARLEASSDASAAIERLESLARSTDPPFLRRIAGFEAVKLLDRTERYREAFDLATFLHASTGGRFDIGGLEADLAAQSALLARSAKLTPMCAPVTGTAMIVALPRSGTTLLEQMLDRHPMISGIGEYEGVQAIGELATASGLWPQDLASLTRDEALSWQRVYCDGADFLRRPSALFTLDKSLQTWRWLPLLATVLPGTVMLAIDRDARDTAISTFLGNFHPSSFGWTASLETVRRVITAHRSLVPAALDRLGFTHESISYEALVDDPAGHAARCLAAMGLAMDAATTAPEGNTRTVLTLSHEQVRKPINRASIGRWRNYEWAFESAWDAL